MPNSPDELVRALIAGVAARDWDALPGLYAEDAVVELPMASPTPIRLEGRAALAQHFAAASKLPLKMQAEGIVVHTAADPEFVVAEFDYVATNVASHVSARVANVFCIRARNGLIVQSRDYTDHGRLGAVLGRPAQS